MLCNLYEHRSLNKSSSFRLVAYCITTLFCLMTLMDTKFFSRTFFLQCQPFASKHCQNSIHSRREEGRWFFKSQSWASGGGKASIQRAVFWQMELSSHLIQTKTRKKDKFSCHNIGEQNEASLLQICATKLTWNASVTHGAQKHKRETKRMRWPLRKSTGAVIQWMYPLHKCYIYADLSLMIVCSRYIYGFLGKAAKIVEIM